MTSSSRPAIAGLLLAALLAAGCGAGKGTVAGTVSRKDGKKVALGSVTLVASDGLAYSARIQPDGSYSISNVPAGPARAGVASPDPKAGASTRLGTTGVHQLGTGRPARNRAPVPAEVAKDWFSIKEALADPQTSNLALAVQGGKVSFDIVVD